MSITWWSPATEMRSAHRVMDRLFEQFFGEQVPEATGASMPTYYLPVDVFESEQAYTLVASVPGFRPEQVEITFEDGILSIKAKAVDLKTPGRWLRQERPRGSLVRRLEVPQQVETGRSAPISRTASSPSRSRRRPSRSRSRSRSDPRLSPCQLKRPAETVRRLERAANGRAPMTGRRALAIRRPLDPRVPVWSSFRDREPC